MSALSSTTTSIAPEDRMFCIVHYGPAIDATWIIVLLKPMEVKPKTTMICQHLGEMKVGVVEFSLCPPPYILN